MCELLGMSANVPTDICFSFTGLMQRGGRTGPHIDGWGISFFEGKGVREFKDIKASVDSEIARFLQHYPIKSHIVVSHIRQANSGKVGLENTHPFTRELWGLPWVYAHNGQLRGVKKKKLSYYRPIGTTDSEYALCYILNQLREKFPKYPTSRSQLFKSIFELCIELNGLGVFNILFSDSKYLYCYCATKLSWITRKAPFGVANLKDEDLKINFREETTPNDVVSVIATQPLTDNESWYQLAKGDMLVFEKGRVIKQYSQAQTAL